MVRAVNLTGVFHGSWAAVGGELRQAPIARAIAPINVATGDHCYDSVRSSSSRTRGAIGCCGTDTAAVNDILAATRAGSLDDHTVTR